MTPFYYKNMRKRIFGRRFKRDTNERKALFRSLMNSLVLHGKIRTTEAKAKSIKGAVEKLITHAKNDGENAKRMIMKSLPNEQAVDKIIAEIAPKFITRPGGYTRILRMDSRVKDGAKMVLMTWVEEVSATSFKENKRNIGKTKTKEAPKTPKKTEKKIAKKAGGKK